MSIAAHIGVVVPWASVSAPSEDTPSLVNDALGGRLMGAS